MVKKFQVNINFFPPENLPYSRSFQFFSFTILQIEVTIFTLVPGEGRTVLPVFQGPLPSAEVQPAVRAYSLPLHVAVGEPQQLHVLPLVPLVQLALLHQLEVFVQGAHPPEPLLAEVADVLDVAVSRGALAPVLPRVTESGVHLVPYILIFFPRPQF